MLMERFFVIPHGRAPSTHKDAATLGLLIHTPVLLKGYEYPVIECVFHRGLRKQYSANIYFSFAMLRFVNCWCPFEKTYEINISFIAWVYGLYVHVSLFVWVWIYMYMYGHMCAPACGGQQLMFAIFFNCSTPYVLKQGFSLERRASQFDCRASQLALGSLVSVSQALELQVGHHTCPSVTCILDPNSSLFTLMVWAIALALRWNSSLYCWCELGPVTSLPWVSWHILWVFLPSPTEFLPGPCQKQDVKIFLNF